MGSEIKHAFFWAIGLALGFAVAGMVLGAFGQASPIKLAMSESVEAMP